MNNSRSSGLVVKVFFKNPKYNYITSVNKELSHKEATAYFIGNTFNMGTVGKDNLQRCVHAIAGYIA